MALNPTDEQLKTAMMAIARYIDELQDILNKMRLYERILISVKPEVVIEKTEHPFKEQVLETFIEEYGSVAPTIHRMGIVFLWTRVEVFLTDFLESWLKNIGGMFTLPIFQKVRIDESVASYEALSRDERISLYASRLTDKVKTPSSSAVRVFLKALDNCGLPGETTEDTKRLEKTLRELQQVRNAVVHQNGVIDRHFLQRCPWLEQTYSQGDAINLQNGEFYIYGDAAGALGEVVIERIRSHFYPL